MLLLKGVPVIGYTYWPLFSLVAWAYRQGKLDIEKYLLHIGLWDLKSRSTGLERVATPAVDAFRTVVAQQSNGAPSPR